MKLISSDLTNAINEQIGHEFSAMLQYVNIATYFDGDALPRLAAHFYRQAEEEKEHAMRLVHYVVEAGGTVSIPSTPGTRSEFASAADAVQLAWDAMAEPRFVIAVGACAISGGLYDGAPGVDRGFFDRQPPLIYVPGCPPHPLTIARALLMALGR